MPDKAETSKRNPARSGPMQLTASSGYAIHGLAYLALKKPGTVTFLSEVSEYFAIPPSYLAKVFQTLSREKLVKSYRGARGGYALSRPAEEINLREVIDIFEGPALAHCSLMKGPCKLEKVCEVHRRLHEAQSAYLTALESHTIQNISKEFQRYEDEMEEGSALEDGKD